VQAMGADDEITYTDYCLVHLLTYQTVLFGEDVIYGLSQMAMYLDDYKEGDGSGICSS
jgi:hypothetical protein